MPLVDIQIVSASRAAFERVSAQALADGIGRALGSASGRTWVRLQWLPARDYAENGAAAPSPSAFGPVFVTLGLAEPPPLPERAAQARAVTEAIAPLVPIAVDLVHLSYAPALAGRQAFGGQLVT
jgi:phenylpyruvate tautomerase PptA (4-oxalocrotonate tautomerase family)